MGVRHRERAWRIEARPLGGLDAAEESCTNVGMNGLADRPNESRTMDRISSWKLADELTVYQIALLIAGYDPSEFERDQPHMWPIEVTQNISPYLNAIKNAARSKKLDFTAVYFEGNYNSDQLDWENSTVNIQSLYDWLRLRNFADGFFVPAGTEVDKLAYVSGEFYAPKLAAAVRAWNEVTTDTDALNGKTPKKALEIWLRKHANEYGLTNKDGNPNELGIEEICKVANWKPAGGASPTPVATPTPPEERSSWTRRVRPNPPTQWGKRPALPAAPAHPDIDEDIPF
jgi:hypothetical protein